MSNVEILIDAVTVGFGIFCGTQLGLYLARPRRKRAALPEARTRKDLP